MASNDTAAKENADDMMEKNISPLASDSLSLPQKEQVQRSSSPEFDPKVGENRLRPAGGKYICVVYLFGSPHPSMDFCQV